MGIKKDLWSGAKGQIVNLLATYTTTRSQNEDHPPLFLFMLVRADNGVCVPPSGDWRRPCCGRPRVSALVLSVTVLAASVDDADSFHPKPMREDRHDQTGPGSRQPDFDVRVGGPRTRVGKSVSLRSCPAATVRHEGSGAFASGALLALSLSLSLSLRRLPHLTSPAGTGPRTAGRSVVGARRALCVSLPFRLVPARWSTHCVGGTGFQPVTLSVQPPIRGDRVRRGAYIYFSKAGWVPPFGSPYRESGDGLRGTGSRSPHLVFRMYFAIVPSSEHD